jgi:hypothetical protein
MLKWLLASAPSLLKVPSELLNMPLPTLMLAVAFAPDGVKVAE